MKSKKQIQDKIKEYDRVIKKSLINFDKSFDNDNIMTNMILAREKSMLEWVLGDE